MTNNPFPLEQASKIKLLAMDMDGIMTDGRMYLSEAGEQTRAFHALDGLGIKLLHLAGVHTALITACPHETLVQTRAKAIGINLVSFACKDKKMTLKTFCQKLNIAEHEAAYMGDDWIDMGAMSLAGLAISVPHAPKEVHALAHYITDRQGGDGAVREVCEKLVRALGRFDQSLAALTGPL